MLQFPLFTIKLRRPGNDGSYIVSDMRPILVIALVLLAPCGPAMAVNWEGHDDWLADAPTTRELEANFDGSVAPLPAEPKPCQPRDSVGEVPANPYEQR